MSAGALALTAVGVVLLGSACGWGTFLLFGHVAYTQGVLDGQRQAEQAHSNWHPLLSPEAWNAPDARAGRHRSPDRKTRPEPAMPMRPVLERLPRTR